MPSLLEAYRDYARRPDRILSSAELRQAGYSPGHARVTLHRLLAAGLAKPLGPGRVKLLLPSEATTPPYPPSPPWERRVLAAPGKATGFTVLPQRYPAPRPKEYVVPRARLERTAHALRKTRPDLRVYVDEYHPVQGAVCLYGGRVRGRRASREEALVHVYRNAPRSDFALALQSSLMDDPDLNWDYFRRQPEWPELAAVFVALNDRVDPPPFPAFQTDEAPDLSLDELDTVAQAFTARGGRS